MQKGGLTAENVGAKLRELHGNMSAVARHFGVSRQAVQNYVRARPALGALLRDARESMKDFAESALHSAVFRGEAWAVTLFLKCQAKDRGYVERREVTRSPEEVRAEIERLLTRLEGSREFPSLN